MKRSFFIALTLVLAVVGWGLVCAQDFYVVPVQKGNFAPVPKTGQTDSYGPGDDGALQNGVAWPTPRFTDNGNGTVTDNLTGLIWLKNANCFGWRTWNDALNDSFYLTSGYCGLTDGSQAGDWRLPNLRELQSLVDYGQTRPALPATHPFTDVQRGFYWSSTSLDEGNSAAWHLHFGNGFLSNMDKTYTDYVWCVRGGK